MNFSLFVVCVISSKFADICLSIPFLLESIFFNSIFFNSELLYSINEEADVYFLVNILLYSLCIEYISYIIINKNSIFIPSK